MGCMYSKYANKNPHKCLNYSERSASFISLISLRMPSPSAAGIAPLAHLLDVMSLTCFHISINVVTTQQAAMNRS